MSSRWLFATAMTQLPSRSSLRASAKSGAASAAPPPRVSAAAGPSQHSDLVDHRGVLEHGPLLVPPSSAP